MIIAYLNSLFNDFVWLDQAEILNKKLLISDFAEFFKTLFFDDSNYAGYHRPMYNLIHTFDYALWRENAFGFHLSSLILHCINTVLVYFIVWNFTARKLTSLCVALTFGLLPCHTATVSLIHSKADLLACLFVLVPVYLYSRDFVKKIKPSVLKITGFWCSIFLLALFSKEVAIMLPFFIAAVSSILYLQKKSINLSIIIYPGILGFLFVLFRLSAVDSGSINDYLSFTDRVLTFIPVYVNYIIRTLTSFELTTNDSVKIWNHISAGIYALDVISFAAIVYFQYYFSKKNIFIAAGFIWFNLFLVPVSQLIPILHFRADRFIYMPSIGFILALAFIFHSYYHKWKLQKQKPIFMVFFAIILLLFSVRIHVRNKDFVSDKVMFGKLIQTHPECREAHGFVGNNYLKNAKYNEALFHIEQALKEQKEYYSFVDKKSNMGNLGIVYMSQNRNSEALDIFLELKEQRNYDSEVLYNLGVCYKKQRMFIESKTNLEEYLKINPNNIDALFNLGAVGIELNEKETAHTYFGRYFELNPNFKHRVEIEQLLRNM